MKDWTDNTPAMEVLEQTGTLPNRCIPKIQNRKGLNLCEIDENKIYKFLRTHPQIQELDSMPPYEVNFQGQASSDGKFKAGCRYYISPEGKFFRMEPRKTWLNHCNIEGELIQLGIIPALALDLKDKDESEQTSPIFEELGWIRIMKENAVILSALPPTREEYYAVEEWIEKWGELQSFYLIVYPDATTVKIVPEEYDNFKTATKVVGDIKKFYSSWELPDNQKRLLEYRRNKKENPIIDTTPQKEGELRNAIMDLVATYYQKYKTELPFKNGDKVAYASRVYDEKEMQALADTMLDFWLTAGKWNDKFEKALKEYLNVPYVLTVNSGSSANLLAFNALTDYTLGDRAIKRGDEVITVACGFPTTVSPILQFGAVPVFVDVDIPTYNINVDKLEEAYSPKVKAVMLAHTLGNPFNIKAVKSFCDAHNLWLIEDNCDALGSEYTLDGVTKKTGTFGDIGTSSFYPAHHITTGEGGAVYTSNAQLYRIMKSMRDWGRDCICPSGTDNFCGHRFDGQFGLLPAGYDHKYVYGHIGFNLKMTEMQAAVGYEQLKKMDFFKQRRQENFNSLTEICNYFNSKIILPQAEVNSDPCWFGYLISMRTNNKSNIYTKDNFVWYLERAGIQTRPLFGGNLILHPWFNGIRDTDAYRVVGDLKNSNYITNNTFWVGVSPSITPEKMNYVCDAIIAFFRYYNFYV